MIEPVSRKEPRHRKKTVRCAIYTRKSHEEGLEQDFNSLDAQREAGQAYIKSQQHEGWTLIDTRYDDGGVSGGTLNRPALQQLLTDIEYSGIDLIVVYKVDRLTRSLSDFAKLVDLFDAHNVSFVSVTQQFNTANSMGRLTLNVLLSFAQYEREITGERIRDKIAASKRKGLWMGGVPPLGYRVKDRTLEPIATEAELVNDIFSRYLNHPSLIDLCEHLNQQGHTTKCWTSLKGRTTGGHAFTPKYLYRLLTNPVVTGKIRHKDNVYAGQHPAIISQTLFFNVQSIIQRQSERQVKRWVTPFLLKGKLRHHEGYAMSPSTQQLKPGKTNQNPKTKQSSKPPTRYYVSQKAIQKGYGQCSLKCINAEHIETLTIAAICEELGNQAKTLYQALDSQERNYELRSVIRQTTLAFDRYTIKLNQEKLTQLISLLEAQEPRQSETPISENQGQGCPHPPILHFTPERREHHSTLVLIFHIQIKKLNGRRFLLDEHGRDLYQTSTIPDPTIVEAIGRAYVWNKMLQSGDYKDIKSMTSELGFTKEYVRKHLTLTTLAPDIQNRALMGQLPNLCSVKQLIEASQFLSWEEQRTYLRL